MWSETDFLYLKRHAGKMTTKEIAVMLHKSEDSVRQKASLSQISLAIRKIPQKKIDEANAMLTKGISAAKIVRATGLSHTYIHNLRYGKIKFSKPKKDAQKYQECLKKINHAFNQ